MRTQEPLATPRGHSMSTKQNDRVTMNGETERDSGPIVGGNKEDKSPPASEPQQDPTTTVETDAARVTVRDNG